MVNVFDMSWGRFKLALSERTYIMAILNRTPDSFSDGGLCMREDDAVERAFSMVSEGADIIDIGGESSRPGAQPVSVREELARVIPVIRRVANEIDIPISIDTCKSEVAKEAIQNGASIINDITGLEGDQRIRKVAREFDVPVVIMHMKGTPATMQLDPIYNSLIDDMLSSLKHSIELAKEAGIDERRIIIDPGIGFGKTAGHNLKILNNLESFKALKMPILIGVSRKSYIASILTENNLSMEEIEATGKLMGTAASSAIVIIKGANIIRAHDVKEAVQAARIADAIARS